MRASRSEALWEFVLEEFAERAARAENSSDLSLRVSRPSAEKAARLAARTARGQCHTCSERAAPGLKLCAQCGARERARTRARRAQRPL